MRIRSEKIPDSFSTLPDLYRNLNVHGDYWLTQVVFQLLKMEGKPANSTATFRDIAVELKRFLLLDINFRFYNSKNIFIGHNVISHANNLNVINYNKRFHSVKTFTLRDWFKNFFHELTHLADQTSVFSFDHDGQKDKLSAPMVVAETAGIVWDLNKEKWL